VFLGFLATQSPTNAKEWVSGLQLPKWSGVLPIVGWGAFAIWFGSGELNVYRADGHMLKAMMAAHSKNLPTAISEYQHAIVLDPNNLLARSNLALSLLMLGKNTEALEEAEQLQRLSRSYPKSNLMQVAALVGLRRYSEALLPVERELKLCSHPVAYLYQAAAYMGLGNATAETAALEHLLLANIRGHLEYEIPFVSERVLQLVHNEEDVSRFREIYAQLSSQFPSSRIVATSLAELTLRLNHSSRDPKTLR
jgi:tetratricopeptide (TPR) repeat protein